MAEFESAHVPLGASVHSASPVPLIVLPAVPRHSALVRLTHWIITICFFALLVSGAELVISHPRFYWGEVGNDLTTPLFKLRIPSSRALVPTGYGYVLPDENGWSRYLHFQTAWIVVFTGLLYGIYGFLSGHFRRDLLPTKDDLSWGSIWTALSGHLRFARAGTGASAGPEELSSYNVLQRLTYLFVIFVLFPLVIWTGLAMSPAFVSAFPFSVNVLGGQQSARMLHFFVSLALVLFLFVHVLMVCVSGFRIRMRAMITGRAGAGARGENL